MSAEDMPGNMTDGFHLVVEALKLNGVDTIYGVAGIPITDLLRWRRPKASVTWASGTNSRPATPPQSPAI